MGPLRDRPNANVTPREPYVTPNRKHVRLSNQLVRVESVKRYRQVFDWLDIDRDGQVTEVEFTTRTMNPKEAGEMNLQSEDTAVVRSLFKTFAKAGRRSVTYDKPYQTKFTFSEMLKALYPKSSRKDIERLLELSEPKVKAEEPSMVSEMTNWFSSFDKDGSGQLSKQEFVTALGSAFEPDEVEEMFDMADEDGTGFIDTAEFVEWYENGCRTKHKTPKKANGKSKWLEEDDKENSNPQFA